MRARRRNGGLGSGQADMAQEADGRTGRVSSDNKGRSVNSLWNECQSVWMQWSKAQQLAALHCSVARSTRCICVTAWSPRLLKLPQHC